ncbi:MAG TPA: PQQ-dependent sugar dehydrogenase [Terriglobia bacterium]|nr:PQQ-dependent sugar dehydrogenase [Terriglobia bacterium]
MRLAFSLGRGIWLFCILLLYFLTPSGFPQNSISIVLNPLVSGLTAPVCITHSGDGTGRLFVVEQAGRVLIIQNGSLSETPFLDIRDQVTSGGEMGLLSVAFHPNFKTNRRFFVNYTNRRPNLKSFIAEYHASPVDPNSALTGEKVLLEFDQPFENHKGGQLQFGPDGYLYIGTGDGGSGGDPMGNGQNKNTLLGKILRIDVDQGSPYAIPSDNPFVAGGGLPEIWAYGLRNPWRFSFDRLTGSLFAGDVGQALYEEIDLINRGGNYGWNIMEGYHCYSPSSGCDTDGLTLPINEYGHDLGNAVIGGYVYRGREYPSLNGLYFFGDFGSSRIWCLAETNRGTWERTELLRLGKEISAFGEDEDGELYVVGYGGSIYRLASSGSSGPGETRILVPSTAKTDRFSSTLTILNRENTASGIQLTVRGLDGSIGKTQELTVAPQSLFETKDILGYLGLPSGSYGPLTVESLRGDSLSVESEIYTGQGTAGFLPGLSTKSGTQEKILPEVVDSGQKGQTGTYRSNLGINNLGVTQAKVDVSLFAENGSLKGSTSLLIPPNGMVQVNQIARTLVSASSSTPVNGYLRLESDQPIHAWLSKIDNGTDDPSLEIGIGSDLQGTALQLLIPAVSNTDRYKSLLTVINREDSDNQIKLTFRDIGGNLVATLGRTISGGGFYRSTDILTEMGAPAGLFGSLLIESVSQRLFSAVSEVRSQQGTAGFFPAINPATATLQRIIGEVLDNGEQGTSGTFRTNVGINNLGALSAHVRVQLMSPNGTSMGTLSVDVPAGGMRQINNVVVTVLGRTEESTAYLNISSDQPILAWASKINNGTEDPSILVSEP